MKIVAFRKLASITTLLWLSACITPLDFDAEQRGDNLVVEGFITNNFGPHSISISRLAKFAGDQDGGAFTLINDAEVYLMDDLGVRTDLPQNVIKIEEVAFIPFVGIDTVTRFVKEPYETPASFRGEVGRTYTLHITLTNGKQYVSTPQTILQGPEIDSLIVEFVKLPSADPVDFNSGVEVYTRWDDPPGERNFYMWASSIGTYRLNARPDLYVDPISSVNMPKACCRICYITDPLNQIYVHSDLRTDGTTQTVLSSFLEDDGRRFGDRYHLQTRMFTITPEAFEFHRLVESQLQIRGDVFDPPPAEIRSNLSNVEDEDEVVIGYFGAYYESSKSVFIEPSIIEDEQRPVVLRDDCLTLPRSTTAAPDFWND